MPKSEYLQQTKGFIVKNYTSDFLPQEKGKYHLFGKYDFGIGEPGTVVHIRADIPNDKYLLRYMRMKIIEKQSTSKKYQTQTEQQTQLNVMKLENLLFDKPGRYQLLIEGCMPYNTGEGGQLQLEVLANKADFQLEEVQHVEPVEYSDKYYQSKYGIIFKEKVIVGSEHTQVAMSIRLKKEGKELDKIEGLQRLFRVDVLDHGKVIYSKQGYNQITISHLMFRSNAQLPETVSEELVESTEVKHQYVLQATFDLHEFPACKSVADPSSADITWHLKLYASDTLAVIKDTDKEDRERALKLGWEQAEPGRAEKAKRSRQKFMLQERLRKGEKLTEEEMMIVNEVRERIRKKDEVE